MKGFVPHFSMGVVVDEKLSLVVAWTVVAASFAPWITAFAAQFGPNDHRLHYPLGICEGQFLNRCKLRIRDKLCKNIELHVRIIIASEASEG